MATPSLSFELTSWTGHTVVAPIGEVDFATASQLREYLYALIDAGHGHLLVDLNQVTFLDASGLGVLVGAANRTQPSGGDVELRCTRQMTLRLLRITGLTRRFLIHTDPAPPTPLPPTR